MLELIGFIAIAYIIYKLAPVVLEVGFKFAIICIGLVAFLIMVSIFMSTWTVWVS
jgi:DMSO/TMAO reductase YedYZ heme-binding membrane subunit